MITKCGHFNIVENCEDCAVIKSKWDSRLKINEFEDAEKDGLLKKWTGISIERPNENSKSISNLIDAIRTQEPLQTVQSTWPEVNFAIEEDLLNNPDLEEICKSLCKHGNHSVSPKKMMSIWRAHCEGSSLRQIEKKFKVHNVTAYRVIKKLKEMSKLWK